MQYRFTFYIILSLLFVSPAGFAQGPIGGFPTPKGEVAVALTYSTDNYDVYLEEDGSETDREVDTESYALFVEAGLSDQLALVATLPYLSVNDGEGNLQDASLWIKYNNLDKRNGAHADRLFTAIGLTAPVSNYATDGPDAIGQRATVFQGRLAYQYQHDGGFFAHVQSGIDFQFAPDSRASWPVLLRSGFGGRYFYVEGWLEFVTALERGNQINSAVAGTGSSWSRTGATVYVPIVPQLGVVAGGAWILDGSQIGKSSRLNLGLVAKL